MLDKDDNTSRLSSKTSCLFYSIVTPLATDKIPGALRSVG